MRFTPLLVAALFLTTALAPVTSAAMSREEFERALAEAQDDVETARTAYADGDVEGARAAAARLTAKFTFNQSGASELEEAIKAASAIAIGERVKGLSARLAAAIKAEAPVEDVEAIAEELSPSLNRLVLVAQGKATAASQRSLRTSDAVDAAAEEVLDLVDEAVSLAERGRVNTAVATAKDAFFAFEINGLGPDTETVDKALEDYVENLIVNFGSDADENPGLSQTIESGASAEEVERKAQEVRHGIAEIVEILKATLPPVTLGDSNGDGKVTIVDALLVAQAALGIREKTDDMDVNRDRKVTIVDALLVAQAALGIREL